ncbi:MAG: hypothetical protein QM752_01135 [Gammaproteobacteria bacterium]
MFCKEEKKLMTIEGSLISADRFKITWFHQHVKSDTTLKTAVDLLSELKTILEKISHMENVDRKTLKKEIQAIIQTLSEVVCDIAVPPPADEFSVLKKILKGYETLKSSPAKFSKNVLKELDKWLGEIQSKIKSYQDLMAKSQPTRPHFAF